MRTVLPALCLALAAVAACSSEEKDCTPGAQVSCACAGGREGFQVCNADGAGYDACDCTGGGGGGSGGSGGSGGTAACDPVTDMGCTGGERCGLVALPGGGRQPWCVEAGTLPVNADCTEPAEGKSDECASRTACIGGKCKPLCDFAHACDTNLSCVPYQDIASACEPACDPVTQVRLTDGAAACGSTDPTTPDRGCYGDPMTGAYICARSLHTDWTHRHAITGFSGLNACAPGYQPLLVASTGDPTPVCIAFCDPAATSLEHPLEAGGKAGHTCADRGAMGEECRFAWYLAEEPYPASGNTVGFCFDPTKYTYENPPGSGKDEPVPACTSLSETGHVHDENVPDNVYWGCAPRP